MCISLGQVFACMLRQRSSQFGAKDKLIEGIGYSFHTSSWAYIGWGAAANKAAIVKWCHDCELEDLNWRGAGFPVTKEALMAHLKKNEVQRQKLLARLAALAKQ